MIKVKRALVSVSDKKGLIAFAKGLQALGVEILSTGGTARHLRDAGIPVLEVSDYTGFPEILNGRVKTLHPKIHGGLLAIRENAEHMEELQRHGIGNIDMAVINLYPFESVIGKKNVSLEEAIENIDIGGPAMLRSAAKNFKSAAVVCNPQKYSEVLNELNLNSGLLSDAVLYSLALEAFRHTAKYDGVIADFLARRRQSEEFSAFPKDVHFKFSKIQDLRYGENPHQKAAFYADAEISHGLAKLNQRHGKELSFNNILDLNAAVECVKDLDAPAAVVVKHGNPTGAAQNPTLSLAYRQAWQCDPVSAFGGIIGLNRPVDTATAKLIAKSGFMECVIAPGFESEALALLSQKKNLRLVELEFPSSQDNLDFKKVSGGLLLQEKDNYQPKPEEWRIVTKQKPAKHEKAAFVFGWRIIKHVKSNAILLVKGTKTVGIGCGQTSRVDSIRAAIAKAGKSAKNAALISDAFLPNIDNVKWAAKAGVRTIIQTGGSIADPDVIKEADKARIAMVMTDVRHFRH